MSLFVHHPSSASSGSGRAQGAPPLARPGFSDWLGDRLLSVDNSTGTTVEVLRFRKELGQIPAFEVALQNRVGDLRRMLHPSLATVRSVERLPQDGSLALISDHVPGRRLSEILQTARGPVFALELIRQLTPALATIHRPDPELVHGLLSADRVVVTREGRLVIIEHALGPAVESLGLSADDLRAHFGLVLANSGDPVRFDQRTDVIQLGFVALTLLLGRRLDPAISRAGVRALLDEFTAHSPRNAGRLRPWFERVLQISDHPFENAEQVFDEIDDLPQNDEIGTREPQRAILMFRSGDTPASGMQLRAVPPPVPTPVDDPLRDEPADSGEATPPLETGGVERGSSNDDPADEQEDNEGTETDSRTDPMGTTNRPSRKLVWIAAGFALLSVAQTAIIAGLVMKEPTIAAQSVAAAPPAPDLLPADVPAIASPVTATQPVSSMEPASDGSAGRLLPAVTPATEPPAAPPPLGGRFGGVRIAAPIEVQVFQEGALVGSTAGPIALAEGTHTLDLVNEALAYRSRQTVTIRAGQLTPLRITLPQGRVNINATPWATVWIDGNAAGETPIANLALTIGTHEIVFRHPQLGEQRTTAVVKAEGVARITASFQR